VTKDAVTVINAAGFPETVPMNEFRSAWYPQNPGNPAVARANSIYQRAYQEILNRAGLEVSVVTPGVSVELADAPYAETPELRVKAWLVKYLPEIIAAETKFSVDRRAIAGAIAWEGLVNVHTSFMAGTVRFGGPGKVHIREDRLSKGHPPAEEVEGRGYLPKQSYEARNELLAKPASAITYIAAIMSAYADAASTGGYNIRCQPDILTTFFNGVKVAPNVRGAYEFFKTKKAPEPLKPNPDMGSWVASHLSYIENAVGKPGITQCSVSRGY